MKQYGQRILALLMAVLLVGQLRGPVVFAMEDVQALEAEADIAVDQNTFPDEAFRSWILDGNNLNGAGSDGVLTAEERLNIREINVSGQGIHSLKGIEVFTALEELNCSRNELTDLDVSHNTELKKLYCGYNQLQDLSLQHNSKLIHLNCMFNRIRTLDVSNLTALKTLDCEFNYMEELNINGSTELIWLSSRNNQLTELDLSTNTKLEFVDLFDNALTSIDVSKLSNLQFLHISDNDLTTLDLSHNEQLEDGGFVAQNNNLKEIHLPTQSSLTVKLNNYEEQNPISGYDIVEWYLDSNYKQKVEGDLQATGQTLYGKRVANSYKIYFNSNNGSGSMAALQAVYDKEVTLPEATFTRYGHSFEGWNTMANGLGYDYDVNQSVLNIAGQTRNERITLYAKWAPIQYKIKFNANGGSGTMNDQTATYNQKINLIPNVFTYDGKEFAGWSLDPNGTVRYLDAASVQNLSSQADATVTLYAIWKTPVSELQKPYLERLEQVFQDYSAIDYTEQDWVTLSDAYKTAVDNIQRAEEQAIMEDAYESGIRAMSTVLTREDHINEVISGWKNAYSSVLNLLNTSSLDENNAAWANEQAKAALEELTEGKLAIYSSLEEKEDQEQITGDAVVKLSSEVAQLQELQIVAQWLEGIEGLTTLPLDQVTSAYLNQYRTLIDKYDALSADQKNHISPQVRAQLEERNQLAEQKQIAVSLLRTTYIGFDLNAYSATGQAALLQALDSSISTVEQATSEQAVLSAEQNGLKAMNAVETADQEKPVTPAPNPGDSVTNGGGTGGNVGGDVNIGGDADVNVDAGSDEDGNTTSEQKPESEQSTTVTVTDEKTGTITKITTTVEGKISASVKVPEGIKHVNVTIPCAADDGTVAVLVKEDGSREIVRKSSLTKEGISLYLDGSAKLEIMNNTKAFKDVSSENWYAGAVQFATSRELFTGVTKDAFLPDATMTRAMLVSVLYRLENSPTVNGEASFTDVPEGTWYSQAVHWAVEQGITDGVSSEIFAPNASITRENLAVMLYRYAQNLGLATDNANRSIHSFKDAEAVSTWAKEAMNWACANGILKGNNQMLNPSSESSRAEVATMLMRFVALLTDQTNLLNNK